MNRLLTFATPLAFSALSLAAGATGTAPDICPPALGIPGTVSRVSGTLRCDYPIPASAKPNYLAQVLAEAFAHGTPPKAIRLQLGSGAFRFSEPLDLSPFRETAIEIVGSGATATRLVFTNAHGIMLNGPQGYRSISALTVSGDDRSGRIGDADKDKTGVTAKRGAALNIGPDVVVEAFSRCEIVAHLNSTIFAPGVVSRGNGSDGVVAAYNSSVFARGARATDNEGVGFFAEANSSIDARNTVASGNRFDRIDQKTGRSRGGDGYVAMQNATINADHSTAADNEDNGYSATFHSMISARSARCQGNAGAAMSASFGSTIDAKGAATACNETTREARIQR